MIPQHRHRKNKMALPTNDDFTNCELSTEELEAIAAGSFWSTVKHIAGEVGHVAYYVGVGVAIFGSIFGGIQAIGGGTGANGRAMN
jgi:hypothetical protein